MAEIRAMLVIEMMGRPVEHLAEVMKKLVEKMGGEKGVSLVKKEIHEPKKIEQKEGQAEIFSCFAEVEIVCEEIMTMLRIVFMYMPSHVEIIEPEDLKMKNFEFAEVLNGITQKLHRYDAIAKGLTMEKQILENKLNAFINPQSAEKPAEKTKKRGRKKTKS